MKSWKIGLILLGCLWTGMLPAQNSVLEFPQQVWNFGTIREADGAVSHEFEFENKGKSPVVIEKVTVTCGCTTPQYSREPVRPGGRGTIRIAYNPEGRPGAFRKDITIQSSGGGRNVISITGEVTPRPQEVGELYPVRAGALRLATRTVNLGYVPRGSIKAKTIEYYNDTELPLNMTVVYPKTKPYLDVALSATRIEPKQKGVLTVTYDLRDCDVWGVLSGAFSLMVNDELADTEFSATGIATDDFSSLTAAELERAPKAAFSSQYYHFGNQKAAGELRRDFTLTNDGKEPLVFRDMKLGQRMSTTLDPEREIAPGESVTFSVMLNTKGAPAGKLMDHIVLIVNDPSRPMREIRLAANIAE